MQMQMQRCNQVNKIQLNTSSTHDQTVNFLTY